MTNQLPIPAQPGNDTQHPAWFITGYRQGEKYIAAGSTQLESASLAVEYFFEPTDLWDPIKHSSPEGGQYTFTAVTAIIGKRPTNNPVLAIAWGKDYAEALKRLFEVWAPDGTEPLEIDNKHKHSWRVEGDDDLEPLHYRCEDCGEETGNLWEPQ